MTNNRKLDVKRLSQATHSKEIYEREAQEQNKYKKRYLCASTKSISESPQHQNYRNKPDQVDAAPWESRDARDSTELTKRKERQHSNDYKPTTKLRNKYNKSYVKRKHAKVRQNNLDWDEEEGTK